MLHRHHHHRNHNECDEIMCGFSLYNKLLKKAGIPLSHVGFRMHYTYVQFSHDVTRRALTAKHRKSHDSAFCVCSGATYYCDNWRWSVLLFLLKQDQNRQTIRSINLFEGKMSYLTIRSGMNWFILASMMYFFFVQIYPRRNSFTFDILVIINSEVLNIASPTLINFVYRQIFLYSRYLLL
jgi:hypothetical protein